MDKKNIDIISSSHADDIEAVYKFLGSGSGLGVLLSLQIVVNGRI